MKEERPTIVADQMLQWYGSAAAAVCAERADAAHRISDGAAQVFWSRVAAKMTELTALPHSAPTSAVHRTAAPD